MVLPSLTQAPVSKDAGAFFVLWGLLHIHVVARPQRAEAGLLGFFPLQRFLGQVALAVTLG